MNFRLPNVNISDLILNQRSLVLQEALFPRRDMYTDTYTDKYCELIEIICQGADSLKKSEN